MHPTNSANLVFGLPGQAPDDGEVYPNQEGIVNEKPGNVYFGSGLLELGAGSSCDDVDVVLPCQFPFWSNPAQGQYIVMLFSWRGPVPVFTIVTVRVPESPGT